MPEASIAFDHIGIADVLARHRLAVPINQREYSWEPRHVLDLLQDLTAAIADGKASYFLGTIVLTAGRGSVPEISDGQQRLATTTMLLAAFRDYHHKEGDESLVTSIENEFLHKIDRSSRAYEPQLRLNVQDNEYFRKRVLSLPDSDDRKVDPSFASHELIDKAASCIAKHVTKIVSSHSHSSRADHLNRWIDYLKDTAQVILLRVPDDSNAFVMFETLNDRGLRTSQADLVKNYLFGQSDDRITEAQQRWAMMSGTLESLGDDDITITYLRHLMSALYGHTREREVFDRIKRSARGKVPAISFLDSLAEYAQVYVAIQVEDHQLWNVYPGSNAIRHAISTIRTLRMRPIRPLMLATAAKFEPAEAVLAFRMYVCWSVRFLICGGARSGGVEEAFATRAKQIMDGSISGASQLAEAMAGVVPTDTEFETAFADATVSQSYLARYYLRALERSWNSEPEPEWVPNEDPGVVNLEHVLPAHPEDNWSNVEPELARALYKRIGNMALLQASVNSNANNDSFDSKKVAYKGSGYALTQQIAEAGAWGAEEISKRQSILAKLAVRTWPRSLS